MDAEGAVRDALGRVLTRYVEKYAPTVEDDPEWPSPCVVGEPDEEDMVAWRPVLMESPPALDDLTAGGDALHPDALAFYSSYWAGEVEARFAGEAVLLNTLWNDEEVAALRSRLREHFEAQQQSEAPHYTVPIAGTDSDFSFALDNRTGGVVLEEPGRLPVRVAAPSLTAFLLGLEL